MDIVIIIVIVFMYRLLLGNVTLESPRMYLNQYYNVKFQHLRQQNKVKRLNMFFNIENSKS